MDQYLKIETVANLLQVSAKTIYRLIERGRLRAVEVMPGVRRIKEEDLATYLHDSDAAMAATGTEG
jgi:excisionase family DNA binding protein